MINRKKQKSGDAMQWDVHGLSVARVTARKELEENMKRQHDTGTVQQDADVGSCLVTLGECPRYRALPVHGGRVLGSNT